MAAGAARIAVAISRMQDGSEDRRIQSPLSLAAESWVTAMPDTALPPEGSAGSPPEPKKPTRAERVSRREAEAEAATAAAELAAAVETARNETAATYRKRLALAEFRA